MNIRMNEPDLDIYIPPIKPPTGMVVVIPPDPIKDPGLTDPIIGPPIPMERP